MSTDVAAFGGVVTAAIQNLTNEDYFTYYSQTNPHRRSLLQGPGPHVPAELPGELLALIMLWIDRIHRWTGAFIGLLLAAMGLSGTLLLYEDAWLRATVPHAAEPLVRCSGDRCEP